MKKSLSKLLISILLRKLYKKPNTLQRCLFVILSIVCQIHELSDLDLYLCWLKKRPTGPHNHPGDAGRFRAMRSDLTINRMIHKIFFLSKEKDSNGEAQRA